MRRMVLSTWMVLLCHTAYAATFSPNANDDDADRVVVVEAAVDAPSPSALSLRQGMPLSDAYTAKSMLRLLWVERAFVPGPGQLRLEFNTNTIDVGYGHPSLVVPGDWWSVYARGQLFGAQVLGDHVVKGASDLRRTHAAGYGLVGAYAGRGGRHASTGVWVETFAALEARQWWHRPSPTTGAALVLPANGISVEPTVGFRWSRSSFPSGLTVREGVDGGVSATGFLRPQQQAWGWRGEDGVLDGRNPSAPWSARLEAWMQVGHTLAQTSWLQWHVGGQGTFGWGHQLDDLNRFIVGGDSRYAIAVAGLAWGELLVDQVLAARAETSVVLGRWVQLSVGLDGAVVNDAARVGKLDDVRAIWSPVVRAVTRLTPDSWAHLSLSTAMGAVRRADDQHVKVFAGVAWRVLPW